MVVIDNSTQTPQVGKLEYLQMLLVLLGFKLKPRE